MLRLSVGRSWFVRLTKLDAPVNSRVLLSQSSLNVAVPTKSATSAYHLTQAHAFVDGNKRIGAAAAEAFLETNGHELTMTNEELVDLFLAIASSKFSRDQVEQQLREKVKPKH